MSNEEFKQGMIKFKLEGKIGVAVVVAALSSLLSTGVLIGRDRAQTETIDAHNHRIETLEKTCQTVSVAIARIEENTSNLKERLKEVRDFLGSKK